MKYVSEKRLRDMIENNKLLERNEYTRGINACLATLITLECKELNTWLPIDENTPKDRPLLLLTKEYGKIIGIWFDASPKGWWTANCMPVTPTHYQELPPDPE